MDDLISVSATVDFVPTADLDVGMVVLDIAMPTGFSPVVETVETLVNDNPKIWRYDLAERKVVLYVEDLVANETFNVQFDAKAGYPVTAQPVTSQVYSYYNPQWRAEALGPSVTVADSQEDLAALTVFYNATDGANWEDNSYWLSDQPISEWYGVTNDADGRVTGLYLNDNQLSSVIPAVLANLTKLWWLDLHGNQLSGQVPAELGNLSYLEILYLGNNQLTGCIPAELRDVDMNDFGEVGLPFCAPLFPGDPTADVTATTTPKVRIGSPIRVKATFSEPVNGFTVEDMFITNGSASGLSGSDGGSVYTFDIIPNAIGEVKVQIGDGVAEDYEGFGNRATAQLLLGIPYDDDHDGAIGRHEVLEAVADYFDGRLTREQVLDVIWLYFQ